MLINADILPIYSTQKNDIANEFYVPVLMESKSYDRVSGYFSAHALAYFSKGLEGLYLNKGHYRLIISNQVSEDDFEMMNAGYNNRTKNTEYILNNLSDSTVLENIDKKRIANLAYLIEIGLVDIKIGFTHRGIFHSKYGIMRDADGNKIYFSGSFNETQAAFISNYESITVLKSWDSSEVAETIENEIIDFQKLWDNRNIDKMIFVKKINEILRSELLSYSKGRFIMDSSIFQSDALVLYLEDGKVKLQNNLSSKELNEKNNSVKKIKKKYLKDGIVWDFRENLNYNDIDDIIRLMRRYGTRENTLIEIADSILEFINTTKFEIKEISKRGRAIKKQDEIFDNTFNFFNQIVSNEVYRRLRPVQTRVSFYMAIMKRVANFSVPGSGKTAMMYGTFAYLSSDSINEVDKMIVIGPKSSFKSWKDEFEKVFGNKRSLKVLDIHSANFRPEMLSKNVNQYNLFLFNYESLNRYESVLEKLIDSRTMLVFDEVHKIKGIDTQRAPIAIKIAQKAKYRYVLTGTPIPNSYTDIWNFLHILYNDEYKSYFGFRPNELSTEDSVISESINEKLFPFFWRVTKQELKVPKANDDAIITNQITDLEQSIINLLWKKYGREPFKLYIRLIQFSSNPSLLKKNIERSLFTDIDDEITFEYSDEMADFPVYSHEELKLLNQIDETTKFRNCVNKAELLMNESKTIIIWCIFVDTIHKISKILEEKGYRVAVIYGAVSAEDRETMITDFQNGMYDVLVTNPHTLAESVSLHMICHDALYLEYSFNLTHMLQSRDRIHRLGLSPNQYTAYYYFVSEGQLGERDTLDKKIYNRLKEKESTMVQTIEGTSLSVEYSMDEKTEILKLINEELGNK